MNRMLKYLVLFIVAATITVGAVAAADLEENNFDDKFSALAPVDANFATFSAEGVYVWGMDDPTMWYIFIDNENINDDTIEDFWTEMGKEFDMEKTKNDGDLVIFDVNNDTLGTNAVGLYQEGKVLVVTGEDLNELKKIVKSAKFE